MPAPYANTSRCGGAPALSPVSGYEPWLVCDIAGPLGCGCARRACTRAQSEPCSPRVRPPRHCPMAPPSHRCPPTIASGGRQHPLLASTPETIGPKSHPVRSLVRGIRADASNLRLGLVEPHPGRRRSLGVASVEKRRKSSRLRQSIEPLQRRRQAPVWGPAELSARASWALSVGATTSQLESDVNHWGGGGYGPVETSPGWWLQATGAGANRPPRGRIRAGPIPSLSPTAPSVGGAGWVLLADAAPVTLRPGAAPAGIQWRRVGAGERSSSGGAAPAAHSGTCVAAPGRRCASRVAGGGS